MKCEKCGAEIPEGKLYCEHCGEELHIVPYFEPEVEIQMDESLQHIRKEVIEQTTGPLPIVKTKRKHHYLVWVIILVIFSLTVGLVALSYLFNSPQYQLNQGNRCVNKGEYEEAVEHYSSALEKGTENYVEVYLYMVKCYEMLGFDGQYEEYLLKIIDAEDANENELLIAYTKLIALYSRGNSYQTINSLLKRCKNDNIVNTYKNFLVEIPKFSHEAGYYKEIIPLKITSPQNFKVYYTTDGTDPTSESTMYEYPIFLDNGEYEFRAICVSEHGVASDIVIYQFQIEFGND